MKSDQGTTIVMIVFILLSVLLMVLCWVFYSASKDNLQRAEAAESQKNTAEGNLRTASNDVDTLKEIIGAAASVSASDIKEKFEEQAQALGMPDAAKGFTGLVDFLNARLNGTRQELASANTEKLDWQAKYNALSDITQNKIRDLETVFAREKDKFNAIEKEYNESIAERERIKKQLIDENLQTYQRAENTVAQARIEKGIAERRLNENEQILEKQGNQLAELRTPVLEREDGKIVTVNQLNGIVTLDIGSASGLRNGITFEVFDPSEKNLAKATSKGSIEVSQILGPNRAEARILDTVITEPIMRGDLIYTPVWKPGMHPRFVLSGRMVVPGFGSRSEDNTSREDDLKDVINLILANGGIVDYYMRSDGTMMKVNTLIDSQGRIRILGEEPANFVRGEGGDEISLDTAFLVTGSPDPLNRVFMSNMQILGEQAKVYGVRSISLPELLRRMGWRNAVPTQGYGSRSNESDLAPQPSRPMPVSTGVVSPLYSQQAEVAKRTSPGNVSPLYLDKQPMKPSPGTVSPLYQSDRKPVNAANGRVSGIYGQ